MTRPTRDSNPERDPLLRPFRLQGLEVGRAETSPGSNPAGEGRCDVLIDLDFAGTSAQSLEARLNSGRRRLRSSGVLLVGVPNRFGLRFWSGSPEPRTGRLFETLVGSGATPSPISRLVSRQELLEALARAGFAALEWFFAVPDPTGTGGGTLISERMLAAAPEVASELATARPQGDPTYPRLDLFPEALVGREIARAGLFADLANHFLVAATAAPVEADGAIWSRLRPPEPEVGWHYAEGRKVPIVTVFELGASDLTVSKHRPNGETSREAGEFSWEEPPRTSLAPGEPLRLHLEEHLVAGRSEHFLGDLCRFSDFIQARFGRDRDLSGEALDATVRNATRDDRGAFHLFDLEWRARHGLPVSWWILRNVLSCIEMRGAPIPDLPHAGALYEALCARLGVAPQLAVDLAREAALGDAVRSIASEGETGAIAAVLQRPWPVPVVLGLEGGSLGPGSDLATAHRDLVTAYQRLETWAKELESRLLSLDAGSQS